MYCARIVGVENFCLTKILLLLGELLGIGERCGVHRYDPVRIQKNLFEVRPFAVHHAVCQPGGKHTQRHHRQIAVVGQFLERRGGFRFGQYIFEPGRATGALLGSLSDIGEFCQLGHTRDSIHFETCLLC